jgi:hypothetical protein
MAWFRPGPLPFCICAIAQVTDEPEILARLAAGPLEDFLGAHGNSYFDTIRDLAHTYPRFHHVLSGVWQGSMPKVLWQKIRAVCAGRV